MEYSDRLLKVNCKRIEYISIEERIPLSVKWKLLATNSSSSSKVFLLHAADDYSYPYRCKDSYCCIVENNMGWVSSQLFPFYIIQTGEVILYDRRKTPHPTGLNMATKTEYMKNLPDFNKFSGVDGWTYSNIKCNLNREMNAQFIPIEEDNWKYGFATHGLNNISKGRLKLFKTRPQTYCGTINLKDYIGSDIMDRLAKLKINKIGGKK